MKKSIRLTVEICKDYDDKKYDEYEAKDLVEDMLDRMDVEFYSINDYHIEDA